MDKKKFMGYLKRFIKYSKENKNKFSKGDYIVSKMNSTLKLGIN